MRFPSPNHDRPRTAIVFRMPDGDYLLTGLARGPVGPMADLVRTDARSTDPRRSKRILLAMLRELVRGGIATVLPKAPSPTVPDAATPPAGADGPEGVHRVPEPA